jgi:SAM-dependent methyltransferase
MPGQRPAGTGPGAITDDGCAVDLYALLPAFGEPELVHAAVPAGASILELGCGTGRILRPLAALGHPVVGVDESAEMLAHCRDLATVRARIEGLRLDRRFDAVLMASHLVNTPDPDQRAAWFDAALRHLRPAGTVVIQRHPPGWFDTLTTEPSRRDGIWFALRDLRWDGPRLSATAEYRVDDRRWTHSFTTLRVTDEELADQLRAVGLALDRWLTGDHGWLTARPAAAGSTG